MIRASFLDFVAGLPSKVPDLCQHPLDYVLAHNKSLLPDGLVVECGVYTGTSINKIGSALPDRKVYGFDSFEGLPESWGRPDMQFDKGAFSTQQKLPPVPDNVLLYKGWFEDTLPAFAMTLQREQIAMLHVDCDLYSSTKCVFDTLGHALAPGCVIVFDELFNYPTYDKHEILALHEFLMDSSSASGTTRDIRWIGKNGKVDLAVQRDNGYWDQPAALQLL